MKEAVSDELNNYLFKKYTKLHRSRLVKKESQIKSEKQNQEKIIKRLKTIFAHFSRKQPNISSQSTFDELNEIYETLNLAEWLSIIRTFGFYMNDKREISLKDRSRLKIIF